MSRSSFKLVCDAARGHGCLPSGAWPRVWMRCPACQGWGARLFDSDGELEFVCPEQGCSLDAALAVMELDSDEVSARVSTTPGRLIITAADVPSRSVRWAWEQRLAISNLAVATGVEGLGKGTFFAWLIARLSHGDLPGDWSGQPVDTLIVAGEDGIGDTWRPRLDLAGADLDRVSFLNLGQLSDDWNLRDGIDELRSAVEQAAADVIYIDAALDHMPPAKAGESINSPTFVRQALNPLRQLVRDEDLVGMFGLHPPKIRSANFRDLVQASQAFSAIPRIGWLFDFHPDDRPSDPRRRRVLIRGKGNLGRDPGALEFRIEGRPYLSDDGRTSEREVVADVKPSSVTMADLAPGAVIGSREPNKAEQVADMLRETLSDGAWHRAAPIRAELADAGLNSDSVVKAGRRLAKVRSRKRPGQRGGPWEWCIDQSADGSDGLLDSSAPARARGVSDSDSSSSRDPDPSVDGKNPRIHDFAGNSGSSMKNPSRDGYRAHVCGTGAGQVDLVTVADVIDRFEGTAELSDAHYEAVTWEVPATGATWGRTS
jgi:hypothetical protein